MRDRVVNLHAGSQLTAGTVDGSTAWLELTESGGATATAELTEGEVLMAIEALGMVYADIVGARPDSIARGINRTLRNRTEAARNRRRRDVREAA